MYLFFCFFVVFIERVGVMENSPLLVYKMFATPLGTCAHILQSSQYVMILLISFYTCNMQIFTILPT